MDRARLGKAKLLRSVFEKASLVEADLAGAELVEAYFGGARLARARLAGAVLTHADFSHADLSASDFSGASMFRAKLHATRRDGATLPRGEGWLGEDEDLAKIERWSPQEGKQREDTIE